MYTPPQRDDERPINEPPVEIEVSSASEAALERVRYRGSNNDATFGYLIVLALAVGLTPILPANADMRYTLVWGVMAGFGVLAWLFGSLTRVGEEEVESVAWGVIFGLIVGAPLLLVGGETLANAVERLFRQGTASNAPLLSSGVVLAYVVFVMPTAETLFFRGVLQETRAFWLVSILSTIWSLVLFAPLLDLLNFPGVAILIGVALVLMNLMYSYVRDRNGLAAAWLCQITVNLVVLFIPFITG
jgi:hypothetical protein